MKKLTTILCVLLLLISLNSCLQSEAAKHADGLIAAIESVSLDNEKEILTAEKAVANLSEDDKKTLRNLYVLDSARAEWNSLKKEYMINQVIQAINAIPSISAITLDSETLIVSARTTYESMVGNDNEIKDAVLNYDALVSAEEILCKLKANKIDDTIKAIGTVTLESGEAIQNARAAYEQADASVRLEVNMYSSLLDAEEKFANLKINNVENLINAIGKVTLDSEATINKAQEAYAQLSQGEAKMVSNYPKLEQSQEEFVSLKRSALLSKLEISTDKINGITWYTSPKQPYSYDRCYIFPYVGVSTDSSGKELVRLRNIYNYTSSLYGALFMNKIVLLIDGTKYTKEFDRSKVKYDTYKGDVREQIDELVGYSVAPLENEKDYHMDLEHYLILLEIATSNEAIYRFYGEEGSYGDIEISAEDKAAISEVLELYNFLLLYGSAEAKN